MRPPNKRPLILIVGCDKTALDAVKHSLNEEGYHVAITVEPNRIRSIYEECAPDLMIISADMPDDMRNSVEALVHERKKDFNVHWQGAGDTTTSLEDDVRHQVTTWQQSNNR